MKIIDLKQGSDKWHSWRKKGIGASEISILMGTNPYKTPLQLWELKCGLREEDFSNDAMKHGTKNEPVARRWLNNELGLSLDPLCIEDEEASHCKASLDGFDINGQVLIEIKCPLSESVLKKAKNDCIPDHWYDQMQWQIMLSHPIRAILAIWDYKSKRCIVIDVHENPDLGFRMRKKADAFWKRVRGGAQPDAKNGDYLEIENENLHGLLLEYQKITEECADLTKRKKSTKSEIEEYGEDGSFSSAGFKITKVEPRTTYDVEKMRLDGIDVEKYSKKSNDIGSYRITCPKK